MKYRINDACGHVRTKKEAKELQEALRLINDSKTIAAIEEAENYHSSHEHRREMANELHVAEVTEWCQATWSENFEETMCKICGFELEREKK